MPIDSQKIGLAMQAWQAMTPEQQTSFKPQMRQMMDEYRDQQQAAFTRARSFYTAEDHGLGKDGYDNLVSKLATTTDPLKSRQSLFNDELASLYTGIPANQLESKRGPILQAIAEREFGHTGPIDDGAFFTGMQSLYQMEDGMQGTVLQGVVAGQSAGAIWQNIKTANQGKTGWTTGKERDYAKRVYLQAQELSTIANQVRSVAESLATELETLNLDTDLTPQLQAMRKMDDRQLAMVTELMLSKAKPVEGAGNQLAQGYHRAGLDLINSLNRNANRKALDDAISILGSERDVKAGINVPANLTDPKQIVRYLSTTGVYDRPLPESMRGDAEAPATLRQLSSEEIAQAKVTASEMKEDLQTLAKLEKFANEKLNPATGSNWFTRYFAVPAAKSLPVTLTSLWGGAGLVANARYYEEQEYDRLRGLGVSDEKAKISALPVGVMQSAAEKIQAGFLLGKLPGAKKILDAWAKPGGNALLRGAGYLTSATAGETSVELLQDHIIPALVQDITQAGGDVKWLDKDGPLQTAYRAAPETAAGVFLFGLVGSGAALASDVAGAREMVKDRNLLLQTGYSVEQATEILAVQDPKAAISKARELWGTRAGTQETMRAAAKAAQQVTQKSQAAEQQLEQLGLLPVMGRNQNGEWYVRGHDGANMPFTSYEEANAARWQEIEDRKVGMHSAIRETLEMDERKLQAGEETKQQFTFREVPVPQEVGENSKSLDRRQQQSDVLDDGFERDAYLAANAANAAAPDADAQGSASIILGKSYTEFADGIRRRVMELNQGANPLTVVEESVEDDARKLLTSGKRDWLLSNLRELEKKTGEKLFVTKDDAAVEASDLVEAYSHVATSYFAGKSRKGEGKFANNKGWLDEFRSDLRAMGIKRLLDATATKLYAMFRRAAKLMRLSQKGQLNPEFEMQLARSLGLEQAVHEAGVVQESESLARQVWDGEGGPSFSILPGGKKAVDSDDATESTLEEGAGSGSGGGAKERLSLAVDAARGPASAVESERSLPNHERWDREEERLEAFLKANNMPTAWTPPEGAVMLEGGNEHVLYKHGNDLYKVTKLDSYGKVLKYEPRAHDGLNMVYASPSEYLASLALRNSNFGDAVELVGSRRKRVMEIVTKVPFHDAKDIQNPHPKDDGAVRAYMGKLGYKEVGPGAYYRADDNILVGDAKLDNFIDTPKGLVPVDLSMTEPDADFQAFLKGRVSYSLAPGKGTLDQRLTAMFDPFQKSPELRQKVGLLVQKRIAEESPAFEAVANASRTLASIERERLKRRDAQYGDLRASGATEEEAKTISERDSKSWAKIEKGKIPEFKDKLRPAVRMLDALLSAFPPEVKGKHLNYSGLVDRETPEAMMKFIEKQASKMDKELEKWLKKDADEQFEKLLKKAQPKKDEAGKKRVGKLGADTHELFSVIERAMEWTVDEVNAHIAGLEAAIASGNLTPEQEAHATLEAVLVAQVADWKNADAARKIEALKNAKYALEKGYAEYRLKKLIQAEDRQIRREQLRAETGKAGTAPQRDARTLAENGWKQSTERFLLGLLNFDQALRWVFGDTSSDAQRLSDMERKAANTKEDAMQVHQQAIEDLFTQLAGDKYKGEQLHWKLAQKTLDIQGRKLSELEAVAATMMWMQEDGQRHMIGKLDENGKPVGPWHYDQSFIDEIEAALSPEAKAVRAHLLAEYGGEYDRLNPIYRDLNGINLPRHKNYSPLTVMPIQAAAGQVIDPVTGNAVSATSVTPGSLRNRNQSAIAEPDFRDALQTYLAHTAQMEHWMAYAPFTAEAHALLNNREVGNSVEAAAGKEATKVLRDWIDVFSNGGTRDAANSLALYQGVGKVTNRAAAMALIGRIGTLAVQSTQLTAALAEMPTGAYAVRLGKLLAGQLGWKAALDSVYIQRRLRQMPPIVRQGMEGLRSTKPNQLKHQVAKLGTLLSGADALFTAGTYAIVYDYQLKQLEKAGVTGTQAGALASQAAERITDALAQPTRLGTRSLLENRSTSVWARLGWNFASDARKNAALLMYNMSKKPIPQKMRTFATVWLLSSSMATLIRTAWRDARDDDDEEVFDERHWNPVRLAMATMTGPLQGIPLFGEMAEEFTYAMTGQYLPSGGLLSQGKDAATAIRRVPDYLEGKEEWDTALKDAESLMSAAGLVNESFAAGASLIHIVRDLFGLGQNLEGED